ncbi:MAG: hypothetical protein ACI82A_003876 [Candidatus Azotimanducaceae bacterium]|jgi:hypothetical protein
MTKIEEKVDELLAKHSNLTKVEATKIVTEKIARKRKKRTENTEKSEAKKLKYEARLLKGK